ncbi:unnamed protein product [Timema podura]|uniref:Secreted protein n=1 Tax=Timema podura TaxID=61482 RepID=A0ABN7NRW2_TIMPD|nr:unnamed protein product [Timema podura]
MYSALWLNLLLSVLAACCYVCSSVEQILDDNVITASPQPYSFSYVAGRYPGQVDRQHSETSDGNGVVRDKNGFHPVLSNPVADTPIVAAAKQHHADLFQRIAEEHARIAAERDAIAATADPNTLIQNNY